MRFASLTGKTLLTYFCIKTLCKIMNFQHPALVGHLWNVNRGELSVSAFICSRASQVAQGRICLPAGDIETQALGREDLAGYKQQPTSRFCRRNHGRWAYHTTVYGVGKGQTRLSDCTWHNLNFHLPIPSVTIRSFCPRILTINKNKWS